MMDAFDIALLDWGIGGLSVFTEAERLYPKARILYLSDSGFLPYGKLDEEALENRIVHLLQYAQEKYGVQKAILACNAASTVLPAVQNRLPRLSTFGMIEPGCRVVIEGGWKKVGVIGGNRTIQSGVFKKALGALGVETVEQSTQPLSAWIEQGITSGHELQAEIEPLLAPVRNLPALLLACTHYPAAASALGKILPGVRLLDPGAEAAKQLAPVIGSAAGRVTFLTSGDPSDAEEAALRAFGVEAPFYSLEMPW